jgi:hypothetical protein
MSQRNVELFIGRLLTDAELRQRFSSAPSVIIAEFCQQGWELNQGEMDALSELDVRLWCVAAAGLPSRLQRCSLCADKRRCPPS